MTEDRFYHDISRAKRGSLLDLTGDERRERSRQLNLAANRRRRAREAAKKIGLEGPPLLITPCADDAERLKRRAEAERKRRNNMNVDERAIYLQKEIQRKKLRADVLVEARKARYAINKEKIIAQVMAYQAANPDKLEIYKARKAEKARLRKKTDEVYAEACRATRRRYQKQRLATDEAFRVEKALRSSLNQALKLYGNGRKTQSVTKLIGCTMAVFIKHIESRWADGMSWSNHSPNGWHIDHEIPCSAFDLTDPEQQKLCFHFSNLQPLWADENWKKGGANRLSWKQVQREKITK